jgi:limonene 1,2-monooxygenase
MTRMRFGTFLAPHHPLGEHPALLFRRDLDFAAQLDALGFDEFWCGEHHSTGWEMIASPEMFLAAAGERTHRIMLGTGVTSLPYHHPFQVAQRIVQLDHMTQGRAMFGSGPGALPSDADMLMVEHARLRDMQDEALSVILPLLRGETVSYETDWFKLKEAMLQILPFQENLPMVTASSLSPSGMKLAGKYGIGVLSIASNTSEGLTALPTQWGFAEASAAQHAASGGGADRSQWRVMSSWHLAETREQAEAQAVDGLQRWNNEYTVRVLGQPSRTHQIDKHKLLEQTQAGGAVIGTPDDMVAAIGKLVDITGGFGTLLGFAHDWANQENTSRSWDLFARYVIPEINGHLNSMRKSAQAVEANKARLMAVAGAAVVAQIKNDDTAMAAFAITLAAGQQSSAGASAAAGAALATATNGAD